MKKPTKEQIKKEIIKLKEIMPKVPPISFFGDDNRSRIAAEIRVLEEGMDEDDIFDEFPVSDDDREFGCPAAGIQDSARDARQWLDGESEDGSPSESWKSTIK